MLSVDCTDVLLKKIEELQFDSSISDVIFGCGDSNADAEEIYANSLIFAIWCKPLYNRIQEEKRKGNWPCRVNCGDVPPQVLRTVREFMYTGVLLCLPTNRRFSSFMAQLYSLSFCAGRCAVDGASVHHLRIFAQKWNIVQLQALCDDFNAQYNGLDSLSEVDCKPHAQSFA